MVSFKTISDELEKNGCYSVQSFLDTEECHSILLKVRSLVSNYDLQKTCEYEKVHIANHIKSRELPGKLSDYSKPVIVTRGLNGFDKNMTEIFSIDRLVDIPKEKISRFTLEVIKNLGFSNVKVEYSCYINRGIEDTRGFHRDVDLPEKTSKRLYKMFIYLTDVPDHSYGPYSYIVGSHTMKNCVKISNQLVGKYADSNEYDVDLNPRIFLGSSGTMIMTTQSGLHRGLPQIDKKERVVLVCKIRPN